ncbi:hypothetical protein KSP39_PZI010197 [Platanthera zijinensis]|uniref:Lipid desaturase domain-containing protein n=1 Tax=Platanthera zijinensis TaxID=2320716 RepID=A0AAP0BJM7_9ASPA
MLPLYPRSHLPLLPTGLRRIHAGLNPLHDSSTLTSTWPHRAWVAAGSATVLTSLSHAISAAGASHDPINPVLSAIAGYLLSDLATGVYHWAADNYGSASTPFFGPQIAAFQGHHRRPSTITRRSFANNTHALARAVALVAAPLDFAAGGNPSAHSFLAACGFCIMLCQQFHAWAHEGRRGKLPAAVAAMQDAGVLVSRRQHGRHHRRPYNGNYCIVSGAWDGVLDGCRVFEAAEMVIYFRFGVRPRSWGEPTEEWEEEEAASCGG